MIKASNNLIKEIKKQKHDSSLLFLDNIKIIRDALARGLKSKYILVCDPTASEWEKYDNVYLVDKKTIEMLSDTKTPQGVVCIAEYLQNVAKLPIRNFLVVDGLQDPGNVGTLIRTAYACGFNDIYLIDSVNPTNPKLVRSTVGAIFNANVMSLSRNEFVELATKNNLCLLKADMNGENIFNSKFSGIVGVVVGNEGQGVSEEISRICTKTVRIPMQEGIESLNASISGAIIMYQIAKDSLK